MSVPPLDPARVTAAVTAALGDHAGRVVVVPHTASTSSDLVRAATEDAAGWPDRSVLVADHQRAGRGRAGRTWTTPPGAALTFSVLLRPSVPVDRWGWLPLLAGLAVVRAVADVADAGAVVKWPNDVLVPAPDGRELAGWGTRRKVAGVLADLVPAAHDGHPAVVVGIGVNVTQSAAELPVESATSLTLATGGAVDRTELLGALLGHLAGLDRRWRAADGDAVRAGLAAECVASCVSIGSPVAVDLPGGTAVQGRATGLSGDGALEVTDALGRVQVVLAGDVRHVRLAADPFAPGGPTTGAPTPGG